MGDPFVVGAFSATFMVPVEEWKRKTLLDFSDMCDLSSTFKGVKVELGLYKYADDILRLAVFPAGVPLGDTLRRVAMLDDYLDEELVPFGYKQNRGKQEFGISLSGVGSKECKQWARRHAESILGGKVKDEIRYLGPFITMDQRTEQEVKRRKKAALSSFFSMGGTWS